MITKKSKKVPKAMKLKYDEIVKLTNLFSKKHLNKEYSQLIRYAAAAMCRKRPSPIEKGRVNTWVAGITHAVGFVNFLSDKSSKPYISVSDLSKEYGVSKASTSAKSVLVRKALKIELLDVNWSLSSRIDSNPMAWLISVNGFLVNAKTLPREMQEIAFNKGLIPYIPDDNK